MAPKFTADEINVIEFLKDGENSTKVIADALKIPRNKANDHIVSIYSKLGAKNISEAQLKIRQLKKK